MKQQFFNLKIKTSGQKLYEFTEQTINWIKENNFNNGIINLSIQHTSASIVVQENADPDVQTDLINYFDKLNKSQNGIVVKDKVYDISTYYPNSLIDLISDGNLNNEAFHKELIRNLDKLPKSEYTFSDLQNSNQSDSFGLNIPYIPNEVWACGVTYKKNMELHEQDIEESDGFKGLYSYVYDSERPEIFFKALGHHCVGTNEYITIRSDSNETFIEAELAMIFNSQGDVIGYTAANDITAWDIEKECPLFLNQAKIFKGSCVLGPCIVPEKFIKSPLNFKELDL